MLTASSLLKTGARRAGTFRRPASFQQQHVPGGPALARPFAQLADDDDGADAAAATAATPPRIVTAASLFDGHDASINVMRRLIQAGGAEVIHLAHDRSALDVVNAIIQEDAHAVALTSYQGGHVEYFGYIRSLLDEAGCQHVKIYGGGGGTITPPEIRDMHAAGIDRIFSPEDGRRMGLLGMIDSVVDGARGVDTASTDILGDMKVTADDHPQVARLITLAENEADPATLQELLAKHRSAPEGHRAPVIGLTGTGGAGKSSLLDELMLRVLRDNPELRIALLCVDPTRKRTGGALLGDRIRMNALGNSDGKLFMRSLASRGSSREVCDKLGEAVDVCQATGFDLVFVETSGIGQGDDAITEFVDHSLYVMTPEFGAETQLEKIEMLDVADFVVLNKFERRGALDALAAVRKQVRRNRDLFTEPDEELPVLATIASQFADPSIDELWKRLAAKCELSGGAGHPHASEPLLPANNTDVVNGLNSAYRVIIPTDRVQYLSEIAGAVRAYHAETEELVAQAHLADALETAEAHVLGGEGSAEGSALAAAAEEAREALAASGGAALLSEYEAVARQIRDGAFVYTIRGKEIRQPTTTTSLSGQAIPRIALPRADAGNDACLSWLRRENVPGSFPYTAGVFPLKRTDEEPKRQFAGEGPAARTNARFHYLSKNDDAKRLSTAFDSVTLYGRDPDERPDIYGKVGNSGVSIFTVDEMGKLFEGFDLCAPSTSVSLTINGPAPAVLAMFLNTAINQQLEQFAAANGGAAPSAEQAAEIKAATLSSVRGTVQADILKEDQAQNTCIFSTEFSLRMMGDIQQFYIDNHVKNHYSVSISGYHIAEAGANPITQLAMTLANGFTYVEYYRSRGMAVDDFAPSLSFFFSNGLDPEYTVIGRVARRIWAVAMRDLYGAGERAQKLKYHIQTSGRSLHAQEVQFNDIRTTLQALLAIQDQCNSLHTNAYDEAVTTPTEESVRRAMAIQMIVNRESGWTKCENPLQGSFLADELTDLVEEAVLQEFERISARGGVLGAMETMYQRAKIQEESMHYEHQKHSGELPLIGVNTFLDENAPDLDDADAFDMEIQRSTDEEKQGCLARRDAFKALHADESGPALARLQDVARGGGNVFEELMETVKVATLGQITEALFKVGGQYRRNM